MSHFPDSPNLIIGWFKDELNAQAYEAVSGIKEKLTNYYHAHDFMTEDFNLIVNMVTDLLHKDRAEVRRDALLEGAKAMCWICADGKHELVIGNDGNYWHKADWLTRCHSQAIHKLIAADQGQSQGKE